MRTGSGIACLHNCLSLATAGAEMKAVAAQNTRVADPVYHVILSWPAGEKPSDEQAFACGAHAIDSVGMGGHQYVFAVHRDTRNVHLHIAVNRVHPVSFRAVDPNRDYYKLDRAMRELELRFGWTHDKGPFAVFERDGKSVVDWARAAPDSKGRMPSPARDMERHSDQESLFSYARGKPREAVAGLLREDGVNWQSLHAMLSQYGLALREKGRGLAVYAVGADGVAGQALAIKASDMHEELSKARLVTRLGAFEPALAQPHTPGEAYDRFREPQRDIGLRAERRQERADARRALRARFEADRAALVTEVVDPESVRDRFRAIRAAAVRRRLEVRTGISEPAARKAQYSVIAFETARELERLRAQVRAERAAVRLRNNAARSSFRAWVEKQAAMGDGAALAQLRGWAYSEDRNAARGVPRPGARTRGRNGFSPGGDGKRQPSVTIPGMTFTARRDGSVRYRAEYGVAEFIDHGDFVEVGGMQERPAALAAALLFARGSFGANVVVEGDAAFQSEVASLMARAPTQENLQRELASMLNDPAQVRAAQAARKLKRDRV